MMDWDKGRRVNLFFCLFGAYLLLYGIGRWFCIESGWIPTSALLWLMTQGGIWVLAVISLFLAGQGMIVAAIVSAAGSVIAMALDYFVFSDRWAASLGVYTGFLIAGIAADCLARRLCPECPNR